MTTTIELDPARVEAFTTRVFLDASAAMTGLMAALGDRLALFGALRDAGPCTATTFAGHAGIHPRYAREWLGCMATAGYVEHDPATDGFSLPPEHAPALAAENGPVFFGGAFEMYLVFASMADRLADAFRTGRGVPQSAYDPRYWEGAERFSAGWYEHQLVQQWVPAVAGLREKLERGVDVADVGCGSGRALIRLAQAFPNSRFFGYDVFAEAIGRARANADAAGVSSRVRFEVCDASRGSDRPFDVVTAFDVLHDAADPIALLGAIRRALADDGLFLCLEMNCGDTLEANAGPQGALMHAISIAYCLTTCLAQDGMALGTLGLHERKLRELAAVVGFRQVTRLPIDNPFNAVYDLRP